MPQSRGTLSDATQGSSRQQSKLFGAKQDSPPSRHSVSDPKQGLNSSRKAMRDPDWRSRKSESGVDHVMIPTGDGTESMAIAAPLNQGTASGAGAHSRAASTRSEESKFLGSSTYTEDMRALADHQGASCSSDVNHSIQSEASPVAHITGASYAINFSHSGIAAVKRHVQVPGLTTDNSGRPFSLIKLQPLKHERAHRDPNSQRTREHHTELINIIRLSNATKTPQNANENFEKHTPRALTVERAGQNPHNRPGVVGGLFSRPFHPSNGKYPPDHINTHEDAVSTSTFAHVGSRSRPGQVTSDFRTAFQKRASEPLQNTPNTKDVSYYRILQKLKGEVASEPPGSDHGFKASNRHDRTSLTSQDTQIHWPQPVYDGTNKSAIQNDSSDSGYASLPPKEKNKSSMPAGEAKVHQYSSNFSAKQFNPKARDFLSLACAQETSAHNAFGINTEAATVTAEYVNPYEVITSFSNPLPVVGGTGPLLSTPNYLYGGLTWSGRNDIAHPPFSGLIPVTNGYQPPLTGADSSHVADSWIQYPRLSSVMAVPLPDPFHHQIARPLLSVMDPSMMSTHTAPRPVPKPRAPNTMDQLRYEAYIEACKATQPGYAQECRMRQQHRAQKKAENRRRNGIGGTGTTGTGHGLRYGSTSSS